MQGEKKTIVFGEIFTITLQFLKQQQWGLMLLTFCDIGLVFELMRLAIFGWKHIILCKILVEQLF